ncbi:MULTISPECIES: SurA N-terminal domain-containing protein [unclassified Beijerinckia]|uniref:SurA N-terminal domain-containing protein n=1 Tax=unclassified Beijerinckia TaxID=2638183 RepID=UPI00089C8048|nr:MULTISPECIES: SurA N-terminal domain-containing protein [unclassified Beijerinckia]MDH7794822.1 peptidyl-prolyl cis-trans isomerase D [Beijerinckia sp. GAS462]SEB76552.1 peptidyl-prolyl cis-trans isomerase D [Beijerinckia sp. 28-YEA-48]
MLEGMRRMTQNWVGKTIMTLLFGVLIASFAVWGIADIFKGFGQSRIAYVGSQEINLETYRAAYQTQLTNLQRQTRQSITSDQARAAGLDRLVLQRLIGEAALDQKAKAMGLALADSDIAASVVSDPTFLGPTGKFDRARFNDALREAGFANEQRFIQEQARVYLRQQIADSLTANLKLPQAMREAIHRYRSETRSVEYFRLPEKAAGEIKAPTDEQLQSFYEARKLAFRAPEYRSFTALAITPATVADTAKISDADAVAYYDKIKAERYTSAETREVQQIVFPDEKAAQEASDKIKAGTTFDAIAQERKLSDKDIALGTLTQRDFVDAAVGKAAYALSEGAVSAPVKGDFGAVLVRVVKINPQAVKPFAEVADEVRNQLAITRARDEVLSLRDKIEDERTAGKSITDAAQALKLKALTFDSVDASGRSHDGQQVADIPEREQLLRAVFASDIGMDNDVITTKDNGYIWYEVRAIDPARERTLAEVRDQVTKNWRDDEVVRTLQEKAGEIVKRLQGGVSFEDAAKELGATVELANDVKRTGSEKLSPAVVARVFSVANGAIASVADGLDRVIFKVVDSVTPPLDADDEGLKAVEDRLKPALSEDILAQYVTRLQNDLGVTINDAAVRMAVGGGDNIN